MCSLLTVASMPVVCIRAFVCVCGRCVPCLSAVNAVMLGLADLRSSCGQQGAVSEWTDEQRDVLDIVHEQSQVVGRILNDVLSLHKIEDGALTLQYSPFSLESMILSTMQSFQPGIHDKQIHYTAQLQTVQQFVFTESGAEELQRLPQVDVVGDKYRLRQVLANFLSNAIKFTPNLGNVHVSLAILPASPSQPVHHTLQQRSNRPSLHSSPSPSPSPGAGDSPSSSPVAGQHAIHIRTQSSGAVPSAHSAANGGGVVQQPSNVAAGFGALSVVWPSGVPSSATFRISVRDTGVGVSAADQTKLFSPYMQILPGELQKGAGTGLGLSISQNLIRIHGGQIGYAVPDDGRGSEFYMEVPMEMLFRQPNNALHATGHSSTPNTSLRLVDGADGSKGDNGSHTGNGSSRNEYGHDDGGAAGSGAPASELDDDTDEAAIGVLPAAEDRQEEDAFIREIADLQLQQHSSRARMSAADDQQASHTALEPPLSASSSSFSSSSSSLVNSQVVSANGTPLTNPLYVSRPALSSPDSSMRVLAQQRMHAQHMRQSNAPSAASAISASATLSPSVHQSSRRLIALTRQHLPSADGAHTPSSVHGGIGLGEDSAVSCSSNGAASVSSRSVSLVMNDAHGPAASPLLYKRSPITLTRRVGLQSNSISSMGNTSSASAADELTDGGHSVVGDSSAASAPFLYSSAGLGSTAPQRRGIFQQQQLDGNSPGAARTVSSPIAGTVASPSFRQYGQL